MEDSNSSFSTERFLWLGLTLILIILIFVLFFRNVSYKDKLVEAGQYDTILTTELEGLQEKGLQDPIKEINADLMNHDELIPYKGVLGGSMRFHNEKDIHILTSNRC